MVGLMLLMCAAQVCCRVVQQKRAAGIAVEVRLVGKGLVIFALTVGLTLPMCAAQVFAALFSR
jgi:hypothetical protein